MLSIEKRKPHLKLVWQRGDLRRSGCSRNRNSKLRFVIVEKLSLGNALHRRHLQYKDIKTLCFKCMSERTNHQWLVSAPKQKDNPTQSTIQSNKKTAAVWEENTQITSGLFLENKTSFSVLLFIVSTFFLLQLKNKAAENAQWQQKYNYGDVVNCKPRWN